MDVSTPELTAGVARMITLTTLNILMFSVIKFILFYIFFRSPIYIGATTKDNGGYPCA